MNPFVELIWEGDMLRFSTDALMTRLFCPTSVQKSNHSVHTIWSDKIELWTEFNQGQMQFDKLNKLGEYCNCRRDNNS